MTRKIGVVTQKGGVAKTTTVVTVAYALSATGRKVLIVDCDSQGHAAKYLGVDPAGDLHQFVNGSFNPAIVNDYLHVVDGGLSVAKVKREIVGAGLMDDPKEMLASAINKVESDYDYILVDAAPSFDDLSVVVLYAVNEVIIPVSVKPAGLLGLADFYKTVEAIASRKPVKISYLLPVMNDGRVKQSVEILDQVREKFGSVVCEPIRYDSKLPQSVGFGQVIWEYAPKSRAAEDYSKFVRRLVADE